jgi:hypothetical protein
MATARINRLGHRYGVFLVIEEDGRLWRVRCTNCGHEHLVSAEKCGALAKSKPRRCGRCLWEPPPVVAQPQKEPPATPRSGILIPGVGFFPYLQGPMGPR